MRSGLIGYSYDAYEEALTRFEAAQALLLNRDDIGQAARMAGSFALVASEVGNISMAEAGHRTAIYAYGLMDETEALGLEPDEIVPVRPIILAEYARLAETLGQAPRGMSMHYKLHRLKREILALGPITSENVVDGVWAIYETENSLAALALNRRRAHAKRSQRLRTMCEMAAMNGGLGLRLLVRDELSPRSVQEWVKMIEKSRLA